MRRCKHCNKEFTDINPRSFSNHVRWCNDNPNRDSWNKYKPLKVDITQICKKCGCEFTLTRSVKRNSKLRSYCSYKCSNSRGPWSDEHKAMLSKKHLERIPEKPIKHCLYCNTQLDIKTYKKYCSDQCKQSKHKERIRNLYKINNLSDRQIYRKECQFKFALNDFPNEFDFTLVEQFGWYKAKNRGNNLTGVSRDHMVSVNYGFKNNISPDIISHPANCCLMRHDLNMIKRTDCSISLDELLKRIKDWDKKYNLK